ncbi:MAG: hypothetical protein F4151_11385 [Gammaproteobacteria bacterium]|nr:PH domain-containing protein [Gemmatimonadota bacterium]MYH50103.1 hypothetical protein [Gammaproteobacteria bacterium]
MAKLDKQLERAREHFDEGEKPLQTVLGAYETSIMGQDTVRNGIFIATDRRLLFYAKKLTGYDFEALPYSNISSMEMGKNLMGHYISFFASGNSCKMKWIKAGDVRAFVDTVNAQMAAAKSNAEPASEQPADPVDQLERLGKLHAAGVLTEAEFSAKKAEILARL